MHARIGSAIIAALALATMAKTAAAQTYHVYSGNGCHESGGYNDQSTLGAQNYNTSYDKYEYCPVTRQNYDSSVSWMRVVYNDQSTSEFVSCMPYYVDTATSPGYHYGASQYSCSSGGPLGTGCPPFTTNWSFTGLGYMTWTNPFGSASFTAYNIGITCTLPAMQNTGTSYITQYEATTTP
jgi:hypothetical protein